MTHDKDAMEKAAMEYENDAHLADPDGVDSSLAKAFEDGARWALNGPAVMALVEALQNLLHDHTSKNINDAYKALAEFEKVSGNIPSVYRSHQKQKLRGRSE
jgi:hypothetical protein